MHLWKMGTAIAWLTFTLASVEAHAQEKFQACTGVLVREDQSLLLKPDTKNESLWCDAYIGEDANSVPASKVLAACTVGQKCRIEGHFNGHGVFYWTRITRVGIHSASDQVGGPQSLEAAELPSAYEEVMARCGPFEMASVIAGCVLELERQIGGKLEVAYRRLRQCLKSSDEKLLVSSQKGWLGYQDASCKLAEIVSRPEGPGVAGLRQAQCLVKTTLQRRSELQDLIIHACSADE